VLKKRLSSKEGIKMDMQQILPLLIMNGTRTIKETILLLISMFIMSMYPKIKLYIILFLDTFKSNYCEHKLTCEYIQNGINNNVIGFSDSFKGVISDTTDFLTNVNVPYTIETRHNITLLNTCKPVKINDDLWVEMKSTIQEKTLEKAMHSSTTMTITLKSKSSETIKKYISSCEEKFREKYKNTNKYIFKTIDSTFYHRFRLETTKTFGSMFFDKKEMLMNKLDDFIINEDRYKRLGIPYTLGLMFHGTPGNGKTSCIKSIAKYTDRHLILISPNIIKNANDLIKIFTSEDLFLDRSGGGSMSIPLNKRIYVFEEIDATDWKRTIRSRKLPPLELEDEVIKVDEKEVVTKKEYLTLGDLLEVLDGIIEINSRIIIMTSNHPEQIDEALLRPGRIDTIIEFKNLSRKDVKQMYHLWFNKDISQHVYASMKDRTYSQANIGKLFSLNNLELINKHLINNTMCE